MNSGFANLRSALPMNLRMRYERFPVWTAARSEIEGVVRRVDKIETAVEPRFQEHFVEALAIPHKSAPSTNLAQAVELPAPRFAVAAGRDGGRRRRPQPASPTPSAEETR